MAADFKILTSNRLELLLDALAEDLEGSPLAPLQAETIIVPGQGLARWISMQLARQNGVAASLDLPFPSAFLDDLLRRLRRDHDAAQPTFSAPFDRATLQFRLFDLLGQPDLRRELGPAAAYCADDPSQQKRMQLAERLARCFDDYQLYRDDRLQAFAEHREDPENHERWQAELWRRLLDDAVGEVADGPSAPATRQQPGQQQALFGRSEDPATQRVWAHRIPLLHTLLDQAGPDPKNLPPRISVFGLATMPPRFLDLLAQLAEHVPVTVYAVKPTHVYYGDQDRRDVTGGTPPDPDSGHPLVAAWGRQSRELFDLLLDREVIFDDEPELGFAQPGHDCLLHSLQTDIANMVVRGASDEAPRLPLVEGDTSLRVLSTHGALREMEVLRDQLLANLEEDPSLSPSDFMVLLPDVTRYAPYIQAVFGPTKNLLPFRVADRSAANELPQPATLTHLMKLARSRFTGPEVLLLLESPAVARRFSIAKSELRSLRDWVERARIRWGLDGQHRSQSHDLPADDANTWRQGMDRLLLGYMTGPTEQSVNGMLPIADGTAARGVRLGRFATFLDTVASLCDSLGRAHTLDGWADAIEGVSQRMFLTRSDDPPQGDDCLAQITQSLRDLSDRSKLTEAIAPAAMARWLDGKLAELGSGHNFLDGALTFAALRPMRAIPVKVLAICGLGDGNFPRTSRRPVFDLLETERRPGDRNSRDDDRQLFLDSLLAARQQLLLSYIGRSAKDNSPLAPSPVLSELLEHVDQAFTAPDGSSAREFVYVQHPLQAFSPDYQPDDERLFTFSHLAPGETSTAGSEDPKDWAAASPACPTGQHRREVIQLDDLVRFWRHPVKWFCRNALEVRFRNFDNRRNEDEEVEAFALGALEKYTLMDEGVRARLDGLTNPTDPETLAMSGILPLGALGTLAGRNVDLEVGGFAARVAEQGGSKSAHIEVQGSDYVIAGELGGLREDALVLWRPASLKNKDRLRAWVQHAVLCMAADQGLEVPGTTLVLATDRSIEAHHVASAAEHVESAAEHVDRLVEGFRSGRGAPLPFFEHASAAFFNTSKIQRVDEDVDLRPARSKFEPSSYSQSSSSHDQPDPYIELCFRDQDPIADPEFLRWANAVYQPAFAHFKKVGTKR